MSDELKPALSAEEWTSRALTERADLSAYLDGSVAKNLRLVTSNCESGSAAIFEPNELPGLIALANDARRDDDPGKITRADVVVLKLSAEGDHECYENFANLRALAAKLEALLPPEKPLAPTSTDPHTVSE